MEQWLPEDRVCVWLGGGVRGGQEVLSYSSTGKVSSGVPLHSMVTTNNNNLLHSFKGLWMFHHEEMINLYLYMINTRSNNQSVYI